MTSELSLVATGKGSNIMCGDQSDHVLQHWTVDISIDEHEGLTRAKARLRHLQHSLPQVGQGSGDREFIADLGDVAVGRIEPCQANTHQFLFPPTQADLVFHGAIGHSGPVAEPRQDQIDPIWGQSEFGSEPPPYGAG